jgi:xylan 1,4-beta-xylosidase
LTNSAEHFCPMRRGLRRGRPGFALGALTLLCVVAFIGCARSLSAQSEFRYQNPIQTEAVRDPQITKVGNEWYMVATSAPFFDGDGPNRGVKLWRSSDLNHWSFVTLAVSPSPGRWFQARFWAPELFPYKGKWYLTFNCPYPDGKGRQSVGLAVADKVSGPYRVLTRDKPLYEGNDATLFQDDDGKVYLFVSGVTGVQVDLDHARTVGQSFAVIAPGHATDWDGTADGGPEVSVEGPSLIKHEGIYYMLYASWGRGYEEGYATATNVKGPWTKFSGNPIYGAQDEPWAKHFKHVYTQSASIPYTQVAHGSPFVGPDGRVWFGCHGFLKGVGQQPHLIITPLTFDGKGVVHMDLSWEPREVPVPQPFSLQLDGTSLASPDLKRIAESGTQHP